MGQPTMPEAAVYIDYKSPYAYLAKDSVYAIEDELGIEFDWLPFTLDIPSYLGSAQVDERGELVAEDRTEHQWRRVRFAYMDVRRYANLRGLTVRAPQKIWDSSLANIALLWAKAQGREKMLAYNDITFERFWKRELDIEDAAVVSAVLAEANCDTAGFSAFLEGEGRLQHDRIRAQAEDDMGIFGVPTFVVDDEIFWGREHLPLARARLKGETPTGDPASVL